MHPMKLYAENGVLLAGVHFGLLEGVHGLLETMFERVFMVTDRSSLIEGAGRLQPAVIVADISYAAGDAFDLLHRLRERAPVAKVVLISAHDEPSVATTALATGADGFVLKRAIASDLLPAIDLALQGPRATFAGAALT